jgi:hypothetical protein
MMDNIRQAFAGFVVGLLLLAGALADFAIGARGPAWALLPAAGLGVLVIVDALYCYVLYRPDGIFGKLFGRLCGIRPRPPRCSKCGVLLTEFGSSAQHPGTCCNCEGH